MASNDREMKGVHVPLVFKHFCGAGPLFSVAALVAKDGHRKVARGLAFYRIWQTHIAAFCIHRAALVVCHVDWKSALGRNGPSFSVAFLRAYLGERRMIRWVFVIFIGLFVFYALLPDLLSKVGVGRLPGDVPFRLFNQILCLPFTSTVIWSLIAFGIAEIVARTCIFC
jgi:hypothetical protein